MKLFSFLILVVFLQAILSEEFDDSFEHSIERDSVARAEGGSDGGDCRTGSGGKDKDSKAKEKTTNIAQDAANEAAAAKDAQQTAGAQASHQIKVQLAERAQEAAKTAEAAYLGKLAIVEELEKELKEANEVAREEQSSIGEDKKTLDAALKAQVAAQNDLKILEQAVAVEQQNCQHAGQTVKGATLDVTEKEKLIEEAKQQADKLQKQLKAADDELSCTKQAAERAIAAAKSAKQNCESKRNILE